MVMAFEPEPRRPSRWPRARVPDGRLRASGPSGSSTRPSDDPFVAPGAGRDALPPAVGAGARVLRAPRPARGPRGAAGARHRRVELPLPVPRRDRDRPRRGARRRARVGADEGRGDRRAARADAGRGPRRARRRRGRAARALDAGGRLLALGNGGSATDAMDAVADMRHPPARLAAAPALDLTEDSAILTAIANDIGTEAIFARQVIAHGREGDALLAHVHQRQLGQRDRGAGRGAPARAWPRSRWWATTAAGSPPSGWPTTWWSRAREHIPRIQEAQASAWHVLRELVERLSAPAARVRAVEGAVQGVGFRPYVHRLAGELGLAGFVLNDERGVLVEVEGRRPRGRATSSTRLPAEAPPLARGRARAGRARSAPRRRTGFEIAASARRRRAAGAGLARRGHLRRLPGRAVRPRRPPPPLPVHQLHRLRAALHDRARRALRPAAHHDGRLRDVRALPGGVRGPADRRFHAQPNACPECGPSLLLDAGGARRMPLARPLGARGAGRGGQGAGRLPPGVPAPTTRTPCAALRARKHREDKPFALMARGPRRRRARSWS